MQAAVNIEKINQSLLTLKRRFFMGVALSSFICALIACNLLTGMAIIIGARLGYSISFFLAITPGFMLAGAYALLRGFRLMLDVPCGLAILDAYNSAGGLILSVVETRDANWYARLPGKINVPDVKVDFRYLFPLFAGSVVFAILCFYTPVFQSDLANVAVLDFNQLSGQARETITVFEETGVLSAEEALRLQEQLSAINETTDSYDPAKTFEALDQMAQKLQLLKQISASDFRDKLEQLEKSLAAMESMQNLTSDNSQEVRAAKSLLQQLKNLNALNEDEQMMKALTSLQEVLNGNADEKNMEQVVRDLKDYIENEREKARQNMQKLVEAQVIDAETMKQIIDQAGQAGAGDGQDAGQVTIFSSSDGEGQQPSGQAGTSEPWMTAPLDSNRVTSEHSMKYKDENLPLPALESLDSAVVTGMAISAPLAESAEMVSDSRQTGWTKHVGSAEGTRLLLPKHRNTVKKYFNRSRDGSQQ